MNIEITTKIKTAYSSLSKSEAKVGDYILENLDKIMYISVSEVAMTCGVGEATVLRFCKKIGFDGFQGFKKEVITLLEKDTKKELVIENKIFDEMSTMLNHTLNILDFECIKRVASLIKKSNNIYIFGLGLSNICASACELRLSFLGYNAMAFSEVHRQLLKAHLIKEGDLVIGLSVSGESKETIKNVKIAKEAGATVVGITNYNPSSLADISDEVILSASKEVRDSGTTLITLTSQMFIIEQICNELMNIDKQRVNIHRRRIMDTYD